MLNLLKVKWDVKTENHGNIILLYARGDRVHDWLDDCVNVVPYGTCYVILSGEVDSLIDGLRQAGFTVLGDKNETG